MSIAGISGRREPEQFSSKWEALLNSPQMKDVMAYSEYIAKSARKNDEFSQVPKGYYFGINSLEHNDNTAFAISIGDLFKAPAGAASYPNAVRHEY